MNSVTTPGALIQVSARASAASAADLGGPPLPTVLLMGHGTRDPEGAAEYRALTADVQARLGGERIVTPCFLELAEPAILDALQASYDGGSHDIVAVPCFLFGAGHVKNELPTALQAARLAQPDLTVRHGGAIGEDRLPPTETLADIVQAAGLAVSGVEDTADHFWLLARKPG